MKRNRNTYREWERERERQRKREEIILGCIILLVFICSIIGVALLDISPQFSELSR